jgi:hypothetical protein
MNIHNKLREIGFKKCGFYRSEYDKETGWNMVPDHSYQLNKMVGGKFTKVTQFKNHPKSNSVYKMSIDKSIIIWAFIRKNLLSEILVENKNENPKSNDRIVKIWNGSTGIPTSKNDILNFLPKNIKRELILKQLFK